MGFINTKARINGSGVFDSYSEIGDGGAFTPADGPYSASMRAGSRTTTNFAWNVGAGVGVELDKNWTVDVGYRFVGLGSVEDEKGYRQHN
jgi:opacity protein-like surface antigen